MLLPLSCIKCFFSILYNHCDESMHAHSSIKYFILPYNFADANKVTTTPNRGAPLRARLRYCNMATKGCKSQLGLIRTACTHIHTHTNIKTTITLRLYALRLTR